MREEFGTGQLPRTAAQDQGGEETYFHNYTTTYTDNVLVTREEADIRPALRLGTWGKELELITGLGIATFNHPDRGFMLPGKERLRPSMRLNARFTNAEPLQSRSVEQGSEII